MERVGALFELIWNLLGPSWGSFGGGGSWGPLEAFWGLSRGLLGSPGGPLGAVVEGVGDRKISCIAVDVQSRVGSLWPPGPDFCDSLLARTLGVPGDAGMSEGAAPSGSAYLSAEEVPLTGASVAPWPSARGPPALRPPQPGHWEGEARVIHEGPLPWERASVVNYEGSWPWERGRSVIYEGSWHSDREIRIVYEGSWSLGASRATSPGTSTGASPGTFPVTSSLAPLSRRVTCVCRVMSKPVFCTRKKGLA